MLSIQIISNRQIIKTKNYKITYAELNSPMTFDLFDINIIDLQDENLWRFMGSSPIRLNCSNDLVSLGKLISASKSKTIILFPSNYSFLYDNLYGRYNYEINLKDDISLLKRIMSDLLPSIDLCEFIYEKAKTQCGNSEFESSFCFARSYDATLTRAKGSGRPTTIQITNNCIVTTLLLTKQECNLKDFLDAIGIVDNKPNYPQWLVDLEKFDDAKQKQLISDNSEKIRLLETEIKASDAQLRKNLRYKSMLTENGDNLVKVVFDVLEQMLRCDLSQFKDKMIEDFLIKLDTCTFIGEIKGITSNIRSENVTQVDVHYQSYLEKLQEENKQENVKALLIVNPLRNKPIGERDAVHENQIKLAKRNGSLIIPTIDLLTVFEKFLLGTISSESIVKEFMEQTGLIDISKIK